jgi:flavin reductase (DIM6/NTAB) family NADH-FMN oxidoreductase RutF
LRFYTSKTSSLKRKILHNQTSPTDYHQFLLGAISPRPIALVSTIDEQGVCNVAPYSYFNVFSSNPPILAFSTTFKGGAQEKDTLSNIKSTGTAVVNIVNYDIMKQMSISSADFPPSIDEFQKSGFNKLEGSFVSVPMIAESPINIECKLREVLYLGNDDKKTGALIILDILCMHIDENILDNNRIDPYKLDVVARMGRMFYSRINNEAILTLQRPINGLPIGFDGLPKFLTSNRYLSGHYLSYFADLTSLPLILDRILVEQLDNLTENDLIQKVENLLDKEEVQLAYSLLYYHYNND